MKLEELNVYQSSMALADEIWNIINSRDYFAKDAIGKQLIKAVDSVAANLSEGFGRYFYKEEKQFCYYSRGSLFETKTWLTKASKIKLLSEEEFEKFMKIITDVGIRLNNYITSIGKSNRMTKNDSTTNDNWMTVKRMTTG